MVLSYIVSTAGHAQSQNESRPHDIQTIVQLVAEGAEEFGDEKVVGFTSPSGHGGAGRVRWMCNRYSFKEILHLSDIMARTLLRHGVEINRGDRKMISILFPTGLEFLIIWITLMRMGYGVVFIAPQCSSEAILNLYSTTASSFVIHHSKYVDLASETLRLNSSIQLIEMPDTQTHSILTISNEVSLDYPETNPHAVSHVFHSSGTSGLPKPIPNTHARSVSVLPRRGLPSYLPSISADSSSLASMIPPSEPAAFTTTPLFHGGVSDLLRAWMARSVIYFYPTSDVPITTANVVAAVNACHAAPPMLTSLDQSTDHADRLKRYRPTSFLSVPYILSTLVEDLDGEGMDMLVKMDFVSTGGAPLGTGTGDAMVERGIKLVSRLGSSECGFLLSSHRDYENEHDWELLRNDSPYANALHFEETLDAGPSGTKRYEVVVTSEWSSLTKSNREDGSYATGDLYEPHSTKSGVWRYVGRGDDVIVMSNGEKASPEPIESLLSTSNDIQNALIVGSDRAQLGVLLFPRKIASKEAIMSNLMPLIDQANRSSPSYAQISPDMCLVVDLERAKLLPKSSKGTIQRGVANEVYMEEIDRLYSGGVGGNVDESPKRSLEKIRRVILDAVLAIAGERAQRDPIDLTTDLFSWGVDSVMASRIRTAIQKSLYTGESPLPKNLVFEQASIQRISQYIFNRQEGIMDVGDPTTDNLELMEHLALHYGTFDAVASGDDAVCGSDFLMTGGTGSLGAQLVHQICSELDGTSARLVCLVRAKDDAAARTRLLEALSARDLKVDESRLVALAADVTQDRLGLGSHVYDDLVKSVKTVVHAAWPVHFASSLVSFESQIKGARHLIDFVRSCPSASSRFYFCSSIASVLGGSASIDGHVTEVPSDDPAAASPIGYAQSKWVVEKVCRMADETADLQGRIGVLRIGQLCGDTHAGYWNEKEGWPLLIRTSQTTGTLPDLAEEPSWLPVDLAARIILDITRQASNSLVYHVMHPLRVQWSTVLAGLTESGIMFETLPSPEWVARVEQSVAGHEEDPSNGMLPLWSSAYGSGAVYKPQPQVECEKAQEASPLLSQIHPITSDDVVKMVVSWRRSGFLNQ